MWDVGLNIVVFAIFIYFIVINVRKNLSRNVLLQHCSHKNHNWTQVNNDDETKAYYCSICESLMNVEGVLCDFCGICVDKGCINEADEKLECKAVSLPYDDLQQPMKHHWIKGNLPLTAICEICNEECSSDGEPGLVDWMCCWCQRCVHNACKLVLLMKQTDEICDFGKFKLMVIPPGSLEVQMTNRLMNSTVYRSSRRLQLRSVIPPGGVPNWRPLIVVANKKSGNNEGQKILSMFRRLLNPAQVVDLSERDPVAALEWCRLLDKTPWNILVAGGDGTVAWLLNSIEKLHLKVTPAVGIVPLGTGNDLSRVMGWGKEHNSCNLMEASDILHRIQTAESVKLDRWTVTIRPRRSTSADGHRVQMGGYHHQLQHRQMFMYNYMSVGVDAQVALNFHRTRDESRFYQLFSHRIFNKLLYLCFGTRQVVERECKDLEKRVEVFLDDQKVELTPSEGIVVLNIPSWGAGVKLWELGREASSSSSSSSSSFAGGAAAGDVGVQKIDDGKLEVCSLYSSFHIAQLQIGLSQPHRLGQASKVKIKLLDSCAVQIDGEPWYQNNPCEFTITHCNHAKYDVEMYIIL